MNILWILIFLLTDQKYSVNTQSNVQTLNIGAIFSSGNREQELAFKGGIVEANKILTSEWERRKNIPKFQFQYIIKTIKPHDSFEALEKACELLEQKVIAIIGPTDSVAADQIEAIYTKFGIPFFDMSPTSLQNIQRRLSINLYPHYSSITNCIVDFFKSARPKEPIVILYLKSEDLIKYSDLLNKFKNKVLLKKIRFDESFIPLITSLKSRNYYHYIVDIPYWHVQQFIKTTDYYKMTGQYYEYLFTNWDTQLLNLENLTFNNAANIITLSLVPIENQKSNDGSKLNLQEDIYQLEKAKHKTDILTFLTTETAILYDSLQLLAKGVVNLAKLIDLNLPTTLSCNNMSYWSLGISFFNMIKSIPIKSITGNSTPITVDENGWRDNFQISIQQLNNRSYFENINNWNKTHGIGKPKPKDYLKDVNTEISKQTLRVVTMIDSPFAIIRKRSVNGVVPKNPDYWTGFCIDLIKLISKDIGFNFTVEEVHDKKYGDLIEEDGVQRWTGLVGDLINYRADLAVSSLTITYDREKVIDFTTPFMNLGISIIFKKPLPKEVPLFSFLSPLSVPVWGYLIASIISVSLVLTVIGRLTPYEWYNSCPCQNNSEFSRNRFNILNSVWFTVGTLWNRGIDFLPKATSTRIIAVVWWFITLIFNTLYTVNLILFFMVTKDSALRMNVESAEDLSKQVKISYGTLRGGSTLKFFEKSDIPTYKRMYKYMTRNEEYLLVDSNEEGIKKVKKGEYAFILESTTNEYYTQRDCDLMRVGGLLDSKGYGIGLPEGSRYRDKISESILKLQKSQEIEKLRRKYWREFNITTPCAPQEESAYTRSLGINEIGGVFIILFFGIVFGLFIAILELFYKAYKKSRIKKTGVYMEVQEIMRLNIQSVLPSNKKFQTNESANESSPATLPLSSIKYNKPLADDTRESDIENLSS